MSATSDIMTPSVSLFGAPAQVGRVQGELQRDALQERVGRLLRRADEIDTLDALRERADRLGTNVAQVAPHWLEESQALCAAAGIELWQMLALNSLPPDFWRDAYIPPLLANGESAAVPPPSRVPTRAESECTAFFALNDAAVNGVTLLHKNRDERDEVQWMGIKGLEGSHPWIGGSDIGHLGIAQLYAAGNWSGANNSGSQIMPSEYVDCALNDGHVLRYLAEKCAGLDDIVPALQDLLARRLLGGAGINIGMIFLLADATRGLAIECTSRRLDYEWYEGDTIGARTNHFLLPSLQEHALPATKGSLRRLERAHALLNARKQDIGLELCHALACDRKDAPEAGIARNPLDNLGSVTVSAATVVLSEDSRSHSSDADSQIHFYNGHPSYASPVVLGARDIISQAASRIAEVTGEDNQRWRLQRGVI